jgi:ankyrin repeat protein
MSLLSPDDPIVVALTEAIQAGDLPMLEQLLRDHPSLATSRIGTATKSRKVLHIVTDWPGHFPNGPATAKTLIAAGADVNAAVVGPHHSETPLHWAASSDDIAVLDTLLDSGANIEATGSVIGGGTPMADAVAFGQWKAARRLLERGARTNLWQSAALGLLDRVEKFFSAGERPKAEDVTNAFWCACHGGQRGTAEYLLGKGADLNWVGYDACTPLDAAVRRGATELADWLRTTGAKSKSEIS